MNQLPEIPQNPKGADQVFLRVDGELNPSPSKSTPKKIELLGTITDLQKTVSLDDPRAATHLHAPDEPKDPAVLVEEALHIFHPYIKKEEGSHDDETIEEILEISQKKQSRMQSEWGVKMEHILTNIILNIRSAEDALQQLKKRKKGGEEVDSYIKRAEATLKNNRTMWRTILAASENSEKAQKICELFHSIEPKTWDDIAHQLSKIRPNCIKVTRENLNEILTGRRPAKLKMHPELERLNESEIQALRILKEINDLCKELTPPASASNMFLEVRNRALRLFIARLVNKSHPLVKAVKEQLEFIKKNLEAWESDTNTSGIVPKEAVARHRKLLKELARITKLLDRMKAEKKLNLEILEHLKEPFPGRLGGLTKDLKSELEGYNNWSRNKEAVLELISNTDRQITFHNFTPPAFQKIGKVGLQGYESRGPIYTSIKKEDGREKNVTLVQCPILPSNLREWQEKINNNLPRHRLAPSAIYTIKDSFDSFGFAPGTTFLEYPDLPEESEFTSECFGVLEEVGKGCYGKVFKSQEKCTGKTVALKSSIDPKNIPLLEKEYLLSSELTGINHVIAPTGLHVVRNPLSAYGFPEDTRFVEFPFHEGGDPSELWEKEMLALEIKDPLQKMIWKLPHVLDLGIQMTTALEEVHKRGVVHGDLKTSNLLSKKKDEMGYETHLCDWGSAQKMNEPGNTGTPTYASPEMFHEKGYQSAAHQDVYALGITLYILLTGDNDPFETKKIQEANTHDGTRDDAGIISIMKNKKGLIEDKIKNDIIWQDFSLEKRFKDFCASQNTSIEGKNGEVSLVVTLIKNHLQNAILSNPEQRYRVNSLRQGLELTIKKRQSCLEEKRKAEEEAKAEEIRRQNETKRIRDELEKRKDSGRTTRPSSGITESETTRLRRQQYFSQENTPPSGVE